jgi:hypothetical protein
MAAKVLSLISGILSGGGDQSGGAAGFLKPIDTERIAHEFKLAELGCESGRRETPSSDATQLDATEQKVIQHGESEWRWHGGELINHLRAYATRLVGFSIDAEFERLSLKSNDTLARLRAAHHIAGAELDHLRDAYKEARSEHGRFRTKHRLERPARVHSGRWTALGLLIILVAVESAFNGIFFAKGAQFGLVGGIGTAMGISVVNVAAAFIIGLGPSRWLHHRNLLIKAIGLLLVIAGLASLLGLHAFAAHLRDATAAVGEAKAMAAAIEHILQYPWALAELSSVYLFVLGLLFGLAALWKGYKFDDPYPGYGAQWRRFEAARDAYTDGHADLFDELVFRH